MNMEKTQREKPEQGGHLLHSMQRMFMGSLPKTIKRPSNIFARLQHQFQLQWRKQFEVKKHKITQPFSAQRKLTLPKWLKRLGFILLFPIRNKVVRYTLLALFTALILTIGYLLKDLPSPRNLTNNERFAVSTQIFDRNGKLLYEIFADEHRVPVDVDEIPLQVKQATIAIEDQRFYHHFGIDVFGILRAVRNNLRGEPVEGGSTITQQLVKNALLSRERSLQRKIKEALLAVITEIIYSKDDILGMYLNYVSYGGTAVGIEAASQQYFDKSVKDLDLAEAALLAGLPQSPSTYSPFGSDRQRAKDRQAEVLRRMVEDGYITQLEAESALAEKLDFALKRTDIQAPHFVFYVRDLLYQEYGVETVEKGGLRVTTTLDLDLQEVAQASVAAEVANLERQQVGNGAAMIIKPDTGEILSMVGSKDYFDKDAEGEVNIALAQRQPGSSIKPLMYATAFQNKVLNPGTVLLDVPTCFEIPGQKPYCPKNYDGTFRGAVTVRQALGNSLNIPAVKGLRLVGLVPFIEQARTMGITTWLDPSNYGLSLTLGGGEVRMIDMAQAFAVLANQGVKVPLTPIAKVEDYKGNVLMENDFAARKKTLDYLTEYDDDVSEGGVERVMDRAPAYLVSHIMQDNQARTAAFGPRSKLVIPNQVVSVKTGTTNDLRDNWTVGFTPEYLVIVWVGNNDNTPMNRYLVSGITGAAPIFNDIMSYVLRDQEPIWQEKPADVSSAAVCASGFPSSLSTEPCKERQTELFWRKSQPSNSKIITKDVWIHPDTGLPLQTGESTDGLQLESKTIYTDPLTEAYCNDCVRTTTEDGKVVYEQHTVSSDFESNQ